MRTLRERFKGVLEAWHADDEFSDDDQDEFLDDLEEHVGAWLRDFLREQGYQPIDD